MLPGNDLENAGGALLGRRRALKLFAATGLAGAIAPVLAACTSSSSTPARMSQQLRVGLIYPQSGPLQEIGFEMSNGFQLFLKQNNNQIAGMTVAVDSIDEGASVASGVSAVRGALKAKSHDVLVGIANSAVMAQIPDNVTAARIPVLGSNGSPADLRASPYLWRTSFVAGEAGKALATYLMNIPAGTAANQSELGRPHSIVVFHDNSEDAQAEAEAFTSIIGGGSVQLHPINGSVSSPSVYNQIKAAGAGLVFAATSVTSGAEFISHFRRAGITGQLCGPGSLTEQATQTASSKNVFTSMNYSPDLNNAANAAFTSAYYSQSNGKVPTTYAMTTYDAAAVLDATITNIQGEMTPQAINTALTAQQSFDSPRGRWQFNQGRTPLQQWYLRQVRLDGAVLDNRSLADLDALP